MCQKEVETNESLNSQSVVSQHLRDYGKQMSEQDILSLTLSGFSIQQQSSAQDLMCHAQQLQQTLQKITACKNQSYQSHNATQKLTHLQQDQSNKNESLQNSFLIHRQFIENVENKIDGVLYKIIRYKKTRQKINKLKSNRAKINSLIHKKYNIGNYIQQMQLVKELIDRINGKINSGNFDYRFLQEIMSKQLIPYAFYHNYCFNIACIIISKRLSQNSLIILKKNANISQLFTHMKTYFFYEKDLYNNCSKLLQLTKFIRVINQQNINIEDGFSYLYKPFFIQTLEEVSQIQCTSFMKARSLMQFNHFTIQTWREFEQYQIQRYVLWNYQQHNQLRKSPLIQLAKLKESVSFFKHNYAWISMIGLKNARLNASKDFISQYLKAALLKIFLPILSKLYSIYICEQKKLNQKKKKQFNAYWFYCIFGKYPNIFRLLGGSLMKQLSEKYTVQCIGEGQLNNDQYYKYYQQMSQIIEVEMSVSLGQEFRVLWTDLWIKFCCLSNPMQSIKQQMPDYFEEIDRCYYIKSMQSRLEQLLLSKKQIKSDQKKDAIYGMILNLNLNSCRYFLIKQATKCLDKSVEKQITIIREAVYYQFYG